MYEESEIARLRSIQKKLGAIDEIIIRHGNITSALSDIEGQPAILMLLVAIAEQLNKLKKHDSKLLKLFSESDLKGIADTRTFIAHDYDGINLSMLEGALRNRIPIFKKIVDDFFENANL